MVMKKQDPAPLPSYKNPPIIEVVCGARLASLEQLLIPHIGLFWDTIRKDFPNCEHAAPLSFGKEDADATTGLPIPRIWLINGSQDRLIQIQKNGFFYNWRKRDDKKAYPRYRTIVNPFMKYIRQFEKFVADNQLGEFNLDRFELTYVNHIVQGQGWKAIKDIGKVVPDCSWKAKPSRFLPAPDNISRRASFNLPEGNVAMRVKLDRGVRKTDELHLFILELKAARTGSDCSLDMMEEWFTTAHDWIVRGFADLTGAKIQKEIWNRDDSYTN